MLRKIRTSISMWWDKFFVLLAVSISLWNRKWRNSTKEATCVPKQSRKQLLLGAGTRLDTGSGVRCSKAIFRSSFLLNSKIVPWTHQEGNCEDYCRDLGCQILRCIYSATRLPSYSSETVRAIFRASGTWSGDAVGSSYKGRLRFLQPMRFKLLLL